MYCDPIALGMSTSSTGLSRRPKASGFWLLLTFVIGTTSCSGAELQPDRALQEQIDAVARRALEEVQQHSLDMNIEYCGYIIKKPENPDFEVVGPVEGNRAGCRTPLVYKPAVIVASFHSHGGADPE